MTLHEIGSLISLVMLGFMIGRNMSKIKQLERQLHIQQIESTKIITGLKLEMFKSKMDLMELSREIEIQKRKRLSTRRERL